MWQPKAGLRRQIWEHTDRSVKVLTKLHWHEGKFASSMNVIAFRRNTMINWSAPAPAGTLQTLEAAELSLFLQGNPLLAPKLYLNSRRFKPIPFWISSPTSLYYFSIPAGPDESCPPSPGARSPISPLYHLPPSPTLHSPSSALICDSSSTVG